MSQSAVYYKSDTTHLSPHFLIIWIGQLLSNIGSGLSAFALGIYVFQLTGSATHYSLILLSSFLPSLLLKPIGGTLADRVNRKILMMIGDFGSAAGIAFIIAMMTLGIKDLWIFYVGTAIASFFNAFQNPAYKALVTDLVEREFYTKASGLMQVVELSKYLISPIIAGFLIKIIHIRDILYIDVLTFLAAVLTVFWINKIRSDAKPITDNHSFFRDFMNGFIYLFKKKEIFILLSIISFITFFIGLLQALLGPMILSFSNPENLGISQTISMTGMLIGSIFLSVFGKIKNRIKLLSTSLMMNGIFFSLMGIKADIFVITLFGFLFFLILPFINASLDIIVRDNVENSMQGRIWSVVSLISQLGMGIAFGIGGYLADNIFNPLLQPGGVLASSFGMIIGIGSGRGIELIFILSGLSITIIAILIRKWGQACTVALQAWL